MKRNARTSLTTVAGMLLGPWVLALAPAATGASALDETPPPTSICWNTFSRLCAECPGIYNVFCLPATGGVNASCRPIPEHCETGVCQSVEITNGPSCPLP